MPWVHLHGWPDGRVYPCCISEPELPIGNMNKDSLKEIWNQAPIRKLRQNMLAGIRSPECIRCYKRERHGSDGLRVDMNYLFKRHLSVVDSTTQSGIVEEFKLRYLDMRFSNICNMKCRSCGGIFSNTAYQEEIKMNKRQHDLSKSTITVAGDGKVDIMSQILEHIDTIEEIYFAGGEPLLMEEHYYIINKLIEHKRFDVRIIYNTNLSTLTYKDNDILEKWKLFKSISIGASLDAEGARGEYMRKGTNWDKIVANRKQMQVICPNVIFFVNSTVSIYNVLHITEFHRSWVEQGLIEASDWRINVLLCPTYLKVDILPNKYKKEAIAKIKKHLEWLTLLDNIDDIRNDYNALISFLLDSGNPDELDNFFIINDEYDTFRNENLIDVFPELRGVRDYD